MHDIDHDVATEAAEANRRERALNDSPLPVTQASRQVPKRADPASPAARWDRLERPHTEIPRRRGR
jgi:hypothetical protein